MTTVLVVVGLYMALMLAIGVIFSKKATDAEGYYLSGRSLPTIVLVFTFAATWIGASSTLGKSGLAYSNGISAISPTIGSFIAFFIFTAFAGRIRKIGAEHDISSIPELFQKRFGKITSLIAALVIAWTMICTTGTQLIAFSKVLEYIFSPFGISYEQALIIGMAIVVLYTVMSGMYGVAYTDVVQGIILLVVIGLIIPFSTLGQIGGMDGLKANLDESYFRFSPDIKMLGYTDQPGVQFYTANFLTERVGKRGKKMERRGAFCLETQNFPDAINKPQFPFAALKAGDFYHTVTEFEFINY